MQRFFPIGNFVLKENTPERWGFFTLKQLFGHMLLIQIQWKMALLTFINRWTSNYLIFLWVYRINK